jgi:hypothetical protein
VSKKIIQSKILENTELVKEIYRLVLQVEGTDHIKPGQFVNVYLDNKSMLLPRPISICSYKDREMTLVYKIVGRGTQELAEYQPGQLLRVSTSQGNGFQLDHLFSTLAEKPIIDSINIGIVIATQISSAILPRVPSIMRAAGGINIIKVPKPLAAMEVWLKILFFLFRV